MSAIDMLIEEFDQQNLPPDIIQKFKDLVLVLKELPHPHDKRTIRKLLDLRGMVARAH